MVADCPLLMKATMSPMMQSLPAGPQQRAPPPHIVSSRVSRSRRYRRIGCMCFPEPDSMRCFDNVHIHLVIRARTAEIRIVLGAVGIVGPARVEKAGVAG